jgi:hypothetical protein
MQIDIGALFLLMGVPTAITSLGLWLLQRNISRRDAEQKKRDEARANNECMLIEGMNAAIALGEATAVAYKNGKTNGEMESALAYARQIKHRYRDFLQAQAVAHLQGDGR